MNRRDTVLAFIALGSVPLAALAQPADKLHRIGFLAGGGAPPDGALPGPLRQALRELGYVEGKTIAYTGRWADAKLERLPELAAELVKLKVDAILTLGGRRQRRPRRRPRRSRSSSAASAVTPWPPA